MLRAIVPRCGIVQGRAPQLFHTLGLSPSILRSVLDQGFDAPTPVQREAIPPLLAGHDVIGIAQTGTGKTAAFTLPVLQAIERDQSLPQRRVKNALRAPPRRVIRALLLAPTRELAAQIGESLAKYSSALDVKHTVIFGGVKQHSQVKALSRGLDVLVATPGRLLDLHSQNLLSLKHVDFFVLDEADKMLDMGFKNDIKKVLEILPTKGRQNLLFSATMPQSIASFASTFISKQAVTVAISQTGTTTARIQQKMLFVRNTDKHELLRDLVRQHDVRRAIVFTRTKHRANKLAQQLENSNIPAAAIHGNKSQAQRIKALSGFKDGSLNILVATDIASRGIDVQGVTHVFNYDLPNEPESYVHRIGRTARAGASGASFSFCDETEAGYLMAIEKLMKQSIPIEDEHAFHFEGGVPHAGTILGKGPHGGGGGGQGRGQGGRAKGAIGLKERKALGGKRTNNKVRHASRLL